jgi:hypothetical protein
MILLAILIAGCGRQNGASTSKDVIGADNTVCKLVSKFKKGSGSIKFFKGAYAECGTEGGWAVLRADSPIQVGSNFPREQIVLLAQGSNRLYYNGVEVGHRPYLDLPWSTLCTNEYRNVCDLAIDPIKLILK